MLRSYKLSKTSHFTQFRQRKLKAYEKYLHFILFVMNLDYFSKIYIKIEAYGDYSIGLFKNNGKPIFGIRASYARNKDSFVDV